MPVSFYRGQTLGRTDLQLHFKDEDNNASDAAEIVYNVCDFTTGIEVLVGDENRVPVHPDVGEYYASFIIPPNSNLGEFRIHWYFKQYVGSETIEIIQEFSIVDSNVQIQAPLYNDARSSLIRRVRILVRDNAPDKNYRWRPPTSEGTLTQFNRVFGFIWEDEEISEYLDFAVDAINLAPPATDGMFGDFDTMVAQKPAWRALILNHAIASAARAIQFNWVADEFDYSIGGISLSIEKSSKYEGLASASEQQFNTQLELAKRTLKFSLGLKQSRFNGGIRGGHKLGPTTRDGVQSPRNWMSW